MNIFTETTPDVDHRIAALQDKVTSLETTLAQSQRNHEFAARQVRELRTKIDNVQGFMRDFYSENGEMNEDLEEIARLLGIDLTKEISGTATFTISFTANVPLDFDADDFEISFDVNCDSYDAEDFEWNEDDIEVNAEEV